MTTANAPIMRLKDRPEFASKPRPLHYRPETTVREAVAGMSERNYGSVVVTDEERRVLGILTERDVMKRIVHEGRDADATRLDEIMTPEPRVARADDDVLDWLRIMSNERFRRLPVVDAEGRIEAVMTQGDFVSYTWPDLVYQARQIAKATIGRNWGIFLVGGGILLWLLAVGAILTSV